MAKRKYKPQHHTNKATNIIVTPDFLKARADRAAIKGFGKAKWITFCEAMMAAGFTITIYEARHIFSKYLTVQSSKRPEAFKVRFSNHAPIKARELQGDCDFFVGVCNTVTTTTDQAIAATFKHFEPMRSQA